MTTIFWICFFLVFYTYVGYGIVLYLATRIKRMFGKKETTFDAYNTLPDVTMMVCAYNEEEIVKAKMENTHALD